MSKTYKVEGMTCGGCVSSVTKAIESAATGAKVEVSLENKTVTVSGFDDDNVIGLAVKAAGFEFGGLSLAP